MISEAEHISNCILDKSSIPISSTCFEKAGFLGEFIFRQLVSSICAYKCLSFGFSWTHNKAISRRLINLQVKFV
ncbi:hypothetical protein CUMW_266790 [Citrus unshiu]|uniref:Uncharacterized protein n=1 Tax=Citrus unshiu TaxID=55188 RepID=A0A2H5QVX3_CITUN|nr:hypothetical protein CUMW_266790 [Citrus unshiu]